ncbi:MAG: tRNA (cytosine(48)-C(5))-methyltransferase [Candidatus Thorarchaeota archaeon]|nr:MAG: tRNA (cytosine(48)-C(5))-methyltransferase [Candidatus Thorarchaeota archaeon]
MQRKELRSKAKEIAKEYGYLPYMIERYLSLWGEDGTKQFLESCEEPIRTAIRINQLRIEIDDLIPRLKEKGVHLQQIPWLKEGFWADFSGYSPGALFEHMLGYYYVQGVPSMTVSRVLGPQSHETIMDLAAAPGGKTTHIAQIMQNTGKVIAIDQDRLRITSLESNIQRCGVINSVVLRGDARKIEQLGIRPNRIMLDAPCSGEGLIPIDASRKTSKSMADIRYCATRQEEMMEAAISTLAPGGILVYSTCSIAPEENEFVIDNILRKHEEVKLSKIELEFGSQGICDPYGVELDQSLKLTRRFLPHKDGTEGFFISKMVKEGESE